VQKGPFALFFSNQRFYEGREPRHSWLPSWVPAYCHIRYGTPFGDFAVPLGAGSGRAQRFHESKYTQRLCFEGVHLSRVSFVSKIKFDSSNSVMVLCKWYQSFPGPCSPYSLKRAERCL
jgi:hypothetical protein